MRARALGRAIQALRAERGMKRRQLAATSGISYPYLAEIEKGRKQPSSQTMSGIASALHVPVSELWLRTETLAEGMTDPPVLRAAALSARRFDEPLALEKRRRFALQRARSAEAAGRMDEDVFTVLLVNDHTLFRLGAREALESGGLARVVGEARGVGEAIRVVSEVVPNVVVIDEHLPDGDALDVVRRLAEAFPQVRCVVLSELDEPEQVVAAVQAGATGYVLKEATRDEFVTAVRRAARGESAFSPSVAMALAAKLRSEDAGAHGGLTARENELLGRVEAGETLEQIAGHLQISPETARNLLENVFAKMRRLPR
jgi:two-component system response regulator DevR